MDDQWEIWTRCPEYHGDMWGPAYLIVAVVVLPCWMA